MQTALYSIWNEAKKLPRFDKIKLMEQLIRSLKIEDEIPGNVPTWEEMYGIGKGIWAQDAQEYVNQLREDRF